MSIPSTIAEYLSCSRRNWATASANLPGASGSPGSRVGAVQNAVAKPLRSSIRLAVMGIVKRWHRAKAAAVIAECGTGQDTHGAFGDPCALCWSTYTALVMAPQTSSEVVPRGSNHRPRGRVFIIDDFWRSNRDKIGRQQRNAVGQVCVESIAIG